jgi:hypothetical protein
LDNCKEYFKSRQTVTKWNVLFRIGIRLCIILCFRIWINFVMKSKDKELVLITTWFRLRILYTWTRKKLCLVMNCIINPLNTAV